MANDLTYITLPEGRMIAGNAYKGRDRDSTGAPLVVKTGPNAGQPRIDFFIGLAIPKVPGHTHWAQSDWGAQIYAVGAAASPNAYQSPAFAWKIVDGDSTVPNKEGRRPCDQEGAKGHWIVKLSGGYAPKVYVRDATGRAVEQPPGIEVLKPGHYVQAYISVAGNRSSQTPGIYINHGMLLHLRNGPEISFGPDANAVFGTGAPGTPVAYPTAGAAPAAPVAYAPPVAPAAYAPPVAPVAPAPVAVVPNPAILAPVAPPAAPVAPAAPQMTAKAGGATYESFIQAGWTDQVMRAQGYLL